MHRENPRTLPYLHTANIGQDFQIGSPKLFEGHLHVAVSNNKAGGPCRVHESSSLGSLGSVLELVAEESEGQKILLSLPS